MILSTVLWIWLTFDSEMIPPIEVSVTRISHCWNFGSSIICKRVRNPKFKPANAIIDWQDGGSTFYLREKTDFSTSEGDATTDRIHVGGTSAAVWCIGDHAIYMPGVKG